MMARRKRHGATCCGKEVHIKYKEIEGEMKEDEQRRHRKND